MMRARSLIDVDRIPDKMIDDDEDDWETDWIRAANSPRTVGMYTLIRAEPQEMMII